MATDTGVRDETVELNGLRFHYRDWGNTGAQPLACLHGFTSHARSWDTFATAMRDRYRVLALDQRGQQRIAQELLDSPEDVRARHREIGPRPCAAQAGGQRADVADWQHRVDGRSRDAIWSLTAF
jgi:pimeloyl-ACP methyl ester carboxylesterase